MTPVRVTVVLTHPIQYYAGWFRHIASHAPELALTVVYATEPTPRQQGAGFDREFTWDIPLRDGYRSIVARAPRDADRVDSGSFWGLDVPEIAASIAGTDPDVVVIGGWYSATLVRALLACRRLGVPTLWRGDSHLLGAPGGWRRPLWALRTRWLLGRFDGYLSPGTRVREYLRAFGALEYRIFDVPHGVDNQRFAESAAPFQRPDGREDARREWGIARDAFVPLFAGKLVEGKRPLDLIEAAARLSGRVTVLLVGSGPLENAARAEAERLGADVRAAGFLNQRRLGRAYAAADCLVLPSAAETWGLVVNEALACGLPVVVAESAGCAPDLVTPETGGVFPAGDIASLTERLDAIRRRTAGGHSWAPACRRHVERYGYEAMTRGLVVACRSVLSRSPGAVAGPPTEPVRVLACCGQMVIVSGLERMTFQVLRTLRESGAAAHCIVNGWENHRVTPLADRIGATWSTGPYWYPLTRRRLTPLVVAKMAWEVVRVSGNLLAEARRFDPTHVLLPDFKTLLRNLPAVAWLRLRGARIVMRLGNAPDPGPFYRFLWRTVIAPFVDMLVCNSAFTERELLAHGVPSSKVRTIPNTASGRERQWAAANGVRIPGRIIYVGQIIPAKGLDLLLEAVAMLRARGREATLDVVGEIDGWEAPAHRGYRQGLRARAAQDDLDGAVAFLGSREDVPMLMNRASVHCCPSRLETREGFGLVVLEAKLSGVPSVVVASGALPELIAHADDGWICDRATPEAIAEGLDLFLADPARAAAAGEAARASAAAYSSERFRAAWLQIFAPERTGAHATFAR